MREGEKMSEQARSMYYVYNVYMYEQSASQPAIVRTTNERVVSVHAKRLLNFNRVYDQIVAKRSLKSI